MQIRAALIFAGTLLPNDLMTNYYIAVSTYGRLILQRGKATGAIPVALLAHLKSIEVNLGFLYSLLFLFLHLLIIFHSF